MHLIQTKQKRAAREQGNKYKPRTETRTTPSNQTRRQRPADSYILISYIRIQIPPSAHVCSQSGKDVLGILRSVSCDSRLFQRMKNDRTSGEVSGRIFGSLSYLVMMIPVDFRTSEMA